MMDYGTVDIACKGTDFTVAYWLRPGKKETVIYVHGLGCTKSDFKGAVRHPVMDEYTLVAFDLPGSGDSPYPEGVTLDMEDLADITAAVTMKLELPQFVLVGHSMGGLVALLCAERYRNRIKSFINIEGNLSPDDCFFSRIAAKYNAGKFTERVFQVFRRNLARSENRGVREYAKSLEMNVSRRAYYDYSCSLVDHSDNGGFIERFIDINVPRLFIYGSENRELRYRPQLKEAGIGMAEVPGSGHFPDCDNPDALYRIIADYLKAPVIER
jgi:pimeloyl-ACP methyl ester carboxylesterase